MKQVHCGDALYHLGKMPNRSVGAFISDPPFFTGIGRDDGGFGHDPWNNVSSIESATDWATSIMVEFRRALRPGGAAVVMAGVHAVAAWMEAAERAGLSWMAELMVLWNTGKPRVHNFGSLHTHILWFAAPGAKHTWNTDKNAIYSNILVCKKVPLAHRFHPAQKPIELTTFLISLLTKGQDLIVDPFCGSGSTLVSAAICGRPFVGIDRDKSHCVIARRRAANFESEDEEPLHLWINGRLEEV